MWVQESRDFFNCSRINMLIPIKRFFLYVICFGISLQAAANDLSLRVSLNKSLARVGDTISCDLVLMNDGKTDIASADISIQHSLALQVISVKSDFGTFDKATGLWAVKNYPASTSQNRMLILFVLQSSGPSSVTAEVVRCSAIDKDSKPGNSDIHEDDLSYGSVTVPIVFCGQQQN